MTWCLTVTISYEQTIAKEGRLYEKRKALSNVKKAKLYIDLTLRLLISYICGAPSKARNANVVYIWTYVWQR